MPNGKIRLVIFTVFLLLLVQIPLWSADFVPGRSAKYPITFKHLAEWMGDSRASLAMFEETIRNDMLAFRVNYHWTDHPTYMLMDDGNIFEVGVSHITVQGMFWGPLFTFGIWEIPCFIGDVAMAVSGGSGDGFMLTKINLAILELSMGAYDQQGSEKIPISGLFRINVLFTSDVLLLDMKTVGGGLHTKSELSLLGRTYAGLTFKILDANYFFIGFNFLHYPYIEGWEEYVSTAEGFVGVQGMPKYSDEGIDLSGDPIDTSDLYNSENLLYETRTKLFLYNNFLDFFQIRALLNLEATEILDTLGAGIILELWDRFDLNSYLSYLKLLDKYSLDFTGSVGIWEGLSIIYSYNIGIKPFNALDYLKLGADFYLPLGEDRGYYSKKKVHFQATAYFVTYMRDNIRQLGLFASVGFTFPVSTRIKLGLGYNVDETMQKLPFSANSIVYFCNFEIGMDNNLDYKLQAKDVEYYVDD